MMSKWWVMLFALCVLPALVSSRRGQPFRIRGKVYCDTCRCGFETNKTSYIPGARVRIEGKDRTTMQLRYSVEGVTDSTGTYDIVVDADLGDCITQSVLVSSPWGNCSVPDSGRNRAPVILTRNNGAISNLHFANSMGFLKDQALPGCAELVKSLLESDQ